MCVKVLEKNPFHFFTEQMVIWPLAMLNKANFENKNSLFIWFLYLCRGLTHKLKTGLSEGGFEIPDLIEAVCEYSESLSSLRP